MKRYLPHIALLLLSVIAMFIPRGHASGSSHIATPPPLQPLHPSRAIDTAGYFFAHDLSLDPNGAVILTTIVGTSVVTTPDGNRVAGGDIRTMSYTIVTDDAGRALANPASYGALVAKMFQDSVVELQFRSQLQTYRQMVVDVTTMQSNKAARILVGKDSPPPVINSTFVPPPSSGSCSLKP